MKRNPGTTIGGAPHLWRRALVLVLLGGLLTGAGCSTMTKRDWLRLFFDGVPDEATPDQPPTPSATSVITNAAVAQPAVATQPKTAPLVQHAPYAGNKCAACHVFKFSQRVARKPLELCFSCHTNFLTTAKVKHAPAEQGECLSCHHPHQSAQKHLLTRKGKALCAECHDDMTPGKVKHAPVVEGECLTCHDPHKSEQKALLRKKGKELCLECHEAVLEGKVKHAPAAEGACLDCHKPHSSESVSLLKKLPPALCHECHDQGDVAKHTAHKELGQKTCTACHNPHSAKFKALMPTATADKSAGGKDAAPK